MGHTREEKIVMKNVDHIQRARTAEAAARAMAKDCDKRIAKAKKALTDIALECDAAEYIRGSVELHKKSFAAIAKVARRANRNL